MSLNSVRLAVKLPIIILALCLVSTTAISVIAVNKSRASLLEQAEIGMQVLLHERSTQLSLWANSVENSIVSYGISPAIAEAVLDFGSAYRSSREDVPAMVRQVYITENPYPIDQRDEFLKPEVRHTYHQMHAYNHPFFRQIKNKSGFHDVFLFNARGDLIYSVIKEDDFATNFVDGPYANTGLGAAYRAAREAEPGQVFVQDFETYGPSSEPAAFISTPVVDGYGATLGVLAIQLPSDVMTPILDNEIGLGESGDVIAFGADGLARSTSRFEGGPTVLDPAITPERLAEFEANPWTILVDVPGQFGENVATLSEDLNAFGMDWRIVAEMEVDEILNPAVEMGRIMTWITVLCVAGTGVLGWLVARSVTRPLSQIDQAMQRVAERVKDVDIPGTLRSDEVGNIAKTLVSFRDQLDTSDALEMANRQQQSEQQRVVIELSDALDRLAKGDLKTKITTEFAHDYEQLRNDYNQSVERLAQTVGAIIENSDLISTLSQGIETATVSLSGRTEHQSKTLGDTASALDGITSSVSSAAEDTRKIDEIVNEAKTDAQENEAIVQNAVSAMSEIEKSSHAISQIIGVIDDIAFQTNLLALNAGVEAARAGESGKGFAVVASEVRALSQRSTDAAKEIKGLIKGSSEHVSNGVDLVGEAGQTLSRILDRIAHISELTSAASIRSKDQSDGLGEINTGVSQLDQVTQNNAKMVNDATQSARSLTQSAQKLDEIVGYFDIDSGPSDSVDAPKAA